MRIGRTEAFNWYEATLPVEERKKRGHFSTPPRLVEQILDACGYTPKENLTHIRVLDPACGSGNFLAEATRRLLTFARQQGLSQEEQLGLIQRNIWGFDPDPISCFLAEIQLRTIVPTSFHIHQADGLTLPWEPCVDLLITNPPYLAAKNNDLSAYQFAQQRGQTDSYLLFLDIALQIVRPDGWIGIVLPDPVLARANAATHRRRLLEAFTLHHLWHLAGVFAAEVGAAVLIAQKRPSQLTHHVFWLREHWRNVGAQFIALPSAEQLPSSQETNVEAQFIAPKPLPISETTCNVDTLPDTPTIPQSIFLRQPGTELRYLLTGEQGTTIERLHSYLQEAPIANRHFAPLEEFLSIRRGEELGRESPYLIHDSWSGGEFPRAGTSRHNAYRSSPAGRLVPGGHPVLDGHPIPDTHLISAYHIHASDWYPILRGGVDVHPYSTPISNWWIAREAIKKPLERYLAPKLLVVKSTGRLQATLDVQGYIALQTLYLLHLRHKDMNEEDLYFFLALLNSRLLREYVYILHTAYKWVQPQIEQSVLARLPVPIVRHNARQEIICRARNLTTACSRNPPVVEWNDALTQMYEELESVIRALYDSSM